MARLARHLTLPPDPIALARRLQDRPGLAMLSTGYGRGRAFVACDPSAQVHSLDPEPKLAFDPEAGPLGAVPRWIGMLPYECRRHLERPEFTLVPDTRTAPHLSTPQWLRYPAVAVVTDRVLVVGDDHASVRHLARLLQRPGVQRPASMALAEPPEPQHDHEQRIRRALELIGSGEIYQVNLARRFRLAVAGPALEHLARLRTRAWAPFAACLDNNAVAAVSSSPELFLEVDPRGRVLTSPIKGTRPRGRDECSDARMVRELEEDPKENAELVMIIDVERNDLGRVATSGSVRLLRAPRVQTHPTVHHRVATIAAHLRPGVSRGQLLEVMLPSGSVTGAPKIRAMEVIAQLEAHRRGLYTGALGALMHDGSLRLAMGIRTLTIREGEGHYFAGGGIVADSDPAREVQETQWKALQLEAWQGR